MSNISIVNEAEKQQNSNNKFSILSEFPIIDKLLPVFIIISITVGLLLGYYVESIKANLEYLEVDQVSLPVAIGLVWMMFPVLAKVKYELIPKLLFSGGLWKQFLFSTFINWIIGPVLMTLLAWVTLPDLPEYRTGVILVGVARCIAMVLLWNHLAGGHPEFCAMLVAINSFFQIILFGPLSLLILKTIPQALGFDQEEVFVSFWQVFKSVLIYLGIPLVLGVTVRVVLLKTKGAAWYENKFLKFISPTSLLGLLFTITVLFAIQGREVIQKPQDVFRVAVPLLLYFVIIFFSVFFACFFLKVPYPLAVTHSFTASGNNFELAIAVSIGTFGISSPQVLATVIGPLIEVPVLVILVYVSLYFKKYYEIKTNPS